MKFIEEKKLKEAFWEKFRYRKQIIKYQFECPIRHGAIDLLTIDHHGDRISLCAFEFKLDDIKKAIAQAEENLNYAHKSFIVLPDNKESLIKNKYMNYLQANKNLGVIVVALDGTWKMLKKAYDKNDRELTYNQTVFKLMLNLL